MWQQLNASKHVDMVKRFSCFSDQISEWGKLDLNDFDHGMIVGARKGGLTFSEMADLLDCHAQQFQEFAENGAKNRKKICGKKTPC